MRIFIAAIIPHEIRIAINNYMESIKPFFDGVKWEDFNKFHLTLKFLGEVDESILGDIENICSDVVKGVSPFKMAISGFGAFPNLKRPRVLFVDLSHNDELLKVQQDLEKKLERIGFARENRQFKCHITVGRIKRFSRVKESISAPDPLPFSISELSIMRSILHKGGSKYDSLFVYQLGGS